MVRLVVMWLAQWTHTRDCDFEALQYAKISVDTESLRKISTQMSSGSLRT